MIPHDGMKSISARFGLRGTYQVVAVYFLGLRTPFRIHGDDTLLKLMDLEAKPQLHHTSASGGAANGQSGSHQRRHDSSAR